MPGLQDRIPTQARPGATMPDTPLGYRDFLDGTTRPVYADADGRQFVQDDDGQPVYGVWILTPDALVEPRRDGLNP
jgi:hypothetical protein